MGREGQGRARMIALNVVVQAESPGRLAQRLRRVRGQRVGRVMAPDQTLPAHLITIE